VLCLQDTPAAEFPALEVKWLGYHVETIGQRAYNIWPTDDDVCDPAAFRDDALSRLEARAHFRALAYRWLTDACCVFHCGPHRYTFWDYHAGRWNRDEGPRINHLLLSPHASDRVVACESTSGRGPRNGRPTTRPSGANSRFRSLGRRARGCDG
jgi:hypothetical protein